MAPQDSGRRRGHSSRSIDIKPDLDFIEVVRTICVFIEAEVDLPLSFQELKTGPGSQKLGPLTSYLTNECEHPFVVSALLALRYHYKDHDDRGINQSRAYACEIVAWKVTLGLSRTERLHALLTDLPPTCKPPEAGEDGAEPPNPENGPDLDERFPLLRARSNYLSIPEELSFWRSFASRKATQIKMSSKDSPNDDDPTTPFIGLNALEIAAVADAKRFLAQRVVQKSIDSIWTGDIMFWQRVSLNSRRKACFVDRRSMDPFCRLRVPKYQKTFEAAFFIGLLVLYYVVMQQDNADHVTIAEVFLYIWIAAFTYEELSTFWDTGSSFYAADLWNMMDLAIATVSIAFIITRVVGLIKGDGAVINIAFDILSLLAIPLLPRTFSLLSLHPYFGTLIPSLTQMTKDLMKFLVIVLVLYAGFASTFVLLARNAFRAGEIMWLLVYIFNGSGYMGLDISSKISHELGPTLMVIFVCITNILLLPTLISLLTNSLTMVMGNAREEFLFQYSILVLESCASKRLTHFFPPLNLIPLIFLRPLRIVLPASSMRSARIVLLKATHAPLLAIILAYEKLSGRWHSDTDRWRSSASGSKALGISPRQDRAETMLDDPVQEGGGLTGPSGITPSSEDRPPLERGVDELLQVVSDLRKQVQRLESKLDAQ